MPKKDHNWAWKPPRDVGQALRRGYKKFNPPKKKGKQ